MASSSFATELIGRTLQEFGLKGTISGTYHCTLLRNDVGLAHTLLIDTALLDVANALEQLIAFGPTVKLHVRAARTEDGIPSPTSSNDYTKLVLKSYEAIEKVLVAILAFFRLEANGVRDAEGHHTFHTDTLSTFNRPNFPLPGLLRVIGADRAEKPFADDTTVYAMIDTLRRLRNKVSSARKEGHDLPADSIVRIARGCSYLCWCLRIFSTLLGAFVICIHFERKSRQTGARIGDIKPWAAKEVKSVVRICALTLGGHFPCQRHGKTLQKRLMATEVEDRKRVRAILQSVQVETEEPPPRPPVQKMTSVNNSESRQAERQSDHTTRNSNNPGRVEQCWAFVVFIRGKRYTSQTVP